MQAIAPDADVDHQGAAPTDRLHLRRGVRTARAIEAADRLADALRDGERLEPRVIEGVPLGPGELAYAELHAIGWRYFALEQVFYDHRMVLAGGPFQMATLALASTIGNSRRRRAADQAAAPQWRSLGPLRIVVTPDRLLVWHRRQWWPVWFEGITGVRCYPVQLTVDLDFASDPPYRLVGPDVAQLGVIISHALAIGHEPA